MAVEYIAITEGSRLGQQARSLAAVLQSTREQAADVKAIMDTLIDGADYSALEQQFGLQAGQGQTLYNLVAGVLADVSTFNCAALVARLG